MNPYGRAPVHGDSRRDAELNWLFRLWESMQQRCENPNVERYPRYGGRGITVHAEWHDYRTFKAYVLANLGPRPEGCSFDRIDNDGNYEPGNVRWATRLEQRRNRKEYIRTKNVFSETHAGHEVYVDIAGRNQCRTCRRIWENRAYHAGNRANSVAKKNR